MDGLDLDAFLKINTFLLMVDILQRQNVYKEKRTKISSKLD